MIAVLLRRVIAWGWKTLPQRWRTAIMREIVAILVGGDGGKIERVEILDAPPIVVSNN